MFVIYHKETTKFLRIFRRRYWLDACTFDREQDAKACLTRESRKTRSLGEYTIAELDHFVKNIEKKEIRHGVGPCLGKEYEVGVNTPWTSGPWSETYFSS